MDAQNKVTVLAAWAASTVIALFCFLLAINNNPVPAELSYALATVLGVAGGVTIPHITAGGGINVAEAIAAHSDSVKDLLHELTTVLAGGAPQGSAPAPVSGEAGVVGGPVVDKPTN